MRLFKVMVVAFALLNAAMFLTSPSSPLSATAPAQVIGFAVDNALDLPATIAKQ